MQDTFRPQILVPLDGSKLARATVEEILPLASATGGSLTLVAVTEPHMDQHFEPFAHAEEVSISDAIETYLSSEARQIRHDSGLDVSWMVVPGVGKRPGEVIAAYAAEHAFDMIAMSTRGLSGFKRLILGSVAKQVLEASQVPVLLFPAR